MPDQRPRQLSALPARGGRDRRPSRRRAGGPRSDPALAAPSAAILALVGLAFAASVAFVVARGGSELTPRPRPSSAVGAGRRRGRAGRAEPPTPRPTRRRAPTPDADTDAQRRPRRRRRHRHRLPTPAPDAEPTPEPTAKPTPGADVGSLRAAEPCPGTPAAGSTRPSGDNLFSIANYFGVPLATVYGRNPWAENGLRAGRELRLPPPTR